ncbi:MULTISPECIES: IPTL-CTERM sorting domain-containing protein [unclassified Brevundimonas]|uniref:IPTL-CTERM sorting domain-containing protein n=1 Tax=unclassified Brevundimonas TaxID=2622653 RepID=UPI003F937BA0
MEGETNENAVWPTGARGCGVGRCCGSELFGGGLLQPRPSSRFTSGATPVTPVLVSFTPAPIPTMTEWAMVLFGVMLAGGAALTIQRRRTSIPPRSFSCTMR